MSFGFPTSLLQRDVVSDPNISKPQKILALNGHTVSLFISGVLCAYFTGSKKYDSTIFNHVSIALARLILNSGIVLVPDIPNKLRTGLVSTMELNGDAILFQMYRNELSPLGRGICSLFLLGQIVVFAYDLFQIIGAAMSGCRGRALAPREAISLASSIASHSSVASEIFDIRDLSLVTAGESREHSRNSNEDDIKDASQSV